MGANGSPLWLVGLLSAVLLLKMNTKIIQFYFGDIRRTKEGSKKGSGGVSIRRTASLFVGPGK